MLKGGILLKPVKKTKESNMLRQKIDICYRQNSAAYKVACTRARDLKNKIKQPRPVNAIGKKNDQTSCLICMTHGHKERMSSFFQFFSFWLIYGKSAMTNAKGNMEMMDRN